MILWFMTTRELNGIEIYASTYNAVDTPNGRKQGTHLTLPPIYKINLFFDRTLNNCVYLFPSIFPIPETENRVICLSPPGTNYLFTH